ncbi:hypothetical protein INR49_021263 [Caranx melampygus]|nr:hypothetical protein INR49_021263 [Caranx melampygus]
MAPLGPAYHCTQLNGRGILSTCKLLNEDVTCDHGRATFACKTFCGKMLLVRKNHRDFLWVRLQTAPPGLRPRSSPECPRAPTGRVASRHVSVDQTQQQPRDQVDHYNWKWIYCV